MVTTSIIIAACIYAAYNAVALAFFGVPESLSNTYYLSQDKCNKGWLFCAMMYLVVAFMMPAWITMSEGSNFQFLSFLAPAGILFVGSAPAFLSSDLENMVHQVSAYLAAAFSLLWIILVTPYWWIILVWVGIIIALSFFTKSVKTSYIYWLEMVAFGSTFTSTIIYSM
jgi:hypothetical protein